MKAFTKEKVLQLHHYLASETGGSEGVRDEGLLESALQSAFATFGGQELYPTLIEKAARIGASLVANHAFFDGNKRIGLFVMLTFLEMNGVRVACTDEDLVRTTLALASGAMSYEGLRDWLLARVPDRPAARKTPPAPFQPGGSVVD